MVATYQNDVLQAGTAPDGLLSSRALFRMNSEDIGAPPPTRQALFRDNVADISGARTPSPFFDMNTNASQLALANGVISPGSVGGYSLAEGNPGYDGDSEDPRDEKAQQRRLAMAQTSMLNDIGGFYKTVVSFAKQELLDLKTERAACTRDMQARDAELREIEAKEKELHAKAQQSDKNVMEAQEDLEDAHKEKAALEKEAENLEGAKGLDDAKGGDTLVTKDGQKVELITGDSASSKEFRIVNENGSLGPAVPREDLLRSDEVEARKEEVPEEIQEADGEITVAEEKLARAQDINKALKEDIPEVLNRMKSRRAELRQGQSADEKRLAGIDRGIENMEKHLEYLESDEVQEKLASGELTIEELREKIDSPLFWNKFSEKHPEFKLEQTELDKGRYSWWYKKQEAAAGETDKPARPESVAGGDIKANKINSTFAGAASGTPTNVAEAPAIEANPAAIVDATQRLKVAGLGL